MPVAVSWTICDPRLSVAFSVPEYGPSVVGEKVMEYWQVELAATEAPQVLLVKENPVPLTVAPLTGRAESLELVSVTGCVAVEPSATEPKARVVGERLADAAVAPPVSVMVSKFD